MKYKNVLTTNFTSENERRLKENKKIQKYKKDKRKNDLK